MRGSQAMAGLEALDKTPATFTVLASSAYLTPRPKRSLDLTETVMEICYASYYTAF
jgi:hypothetical protein